MSIAISKVQISERVEALHRFVLPHVACLAIAPSLLSRPSQMIGAGTASLVEIDGRQLVVTCSHLYSDMKSARTSQPETLFAMLVADNDGSFTLNTPEARRVCDLSGPLDLVAFDYPRIDKLPNSNKRYLRLGLNGIPNVDRGDTLIFAGFPGAFRKTFGCWVNIYSDFVALVASDVSDDTIVAASVGENIEVFRSMDGQFGGFSGSLAYLANDSGTIWPIGIVREWSPLADGLLQITRLTKLAGQLGNSQKQ